MKFEKHFLNSTTDTQHWVKNSSATRHIRTYIYGDLVYKFKRIVRKSNFSDQFKKIVKRYIRVGYNLIIM